MAIEVGDASKVRQPIGTREGPQREWTRLARVCRPVQRTAVALAALGLALLGCVGAANSPGGDPGVLAGVDVLLRDGADLLRDRRVGLITNHTGLTRDGRSTIDALAALPGVRMVALFAPEHGIRGSVPGGAPIADDRDAATGLPIRSLYGETRKPTPAMLADVDVLVFDMQDIGARYYTYVWTMALALEAAAERGLPFVVLDRPNPIGGTRVDGNVTDPAFASFVGLHAVPMRHGMTVGEMARWINETQRLGAALTVVPAAGWRRAMPFAATGLPWRGPSPNMPTVESAYHYPGTCLFEGTNLSVGRGSDSPFQQFGAPWLDGDALARRLGAHGLPGVRIEAIAFTPRAPDDGKYADTLVHGVRLTVTDPATYDPTLTTVTALVEIATMHPDRFAFRDAGFDRLAGTDQLRLAVLRGESAARIAAGWTAAREAFLRTRAGALLYPD